MCIKNLTFLASLYSTSIKNSWKKKKKMLKKYEKKIIIIKQLKTNPDCIFTCLSYPLIKITPPQYSEKGQRSADLGLGLKSFCTDLYISVRILWLIHELSGSFINLLIIDLSFVKNKNNTFRTFGFLCNKRDKTPSRPPSVGSPTVTS